VERVEYYKHYEHSKAQNSRTNPLDGHPPAENSLVEDQGEDPNTSLNQPLPDEWILDYLEVKRLRYVQRMFSLLPLGINLTTIKRLLMQTPPDL
jgi:hypothetical protein